MSSSSKMLCDEVEKLLNTLDKLKREKKELKKEKEELYDTVSQKCLLIYEEKYGKMSDDENWLYLVSDYCATGEGRVVCIMMTQAHPIKNEDFYNDIPNKYDHPVTTKQHRAIREFSEKFGEHYTLDVDFLPKEKFFEKYSNYLPQKLKDIQKRNSQVGYYSKLHCNLS